VIFGGIAILACTLALPASQSQLPVQNSANDARESHAAAHLITRGEVLSAIEHALNVNELQTVRALTVEDLSPFANVSVAKLNPNLRVTQIEADPAGRGFRALIWAVDEPKSPPFWVTVNVTVVAVGTPSAIPPALSAIPENSAAPAAAPPSLINPGDRSTIVIEGNGFRILASGVALERGALGQTVRVRAVATGQIIHARVGGDRLLRASVAEAAQR
jgi:Chaperone for flagella basal body P-ring formation